ncbi:MAG: RHS repeat-associated core domain-containing protein [Thermoanaerobaculia bacterium]
MTVTLLGEWEPGLLMTLSRSGLYDQIGSRTRETRSGSPVEDYSYEPNSEGTGSTARLSNLRNPFNPPFRVYSWDGGGYLGQISAGANVLAYTFDAAGELASVVRGAESLTNTYDGRGFLSQASDATSGGYVKPTYSSQGLLLSQERLPATGGTTERIDVLYFAGRPAAIWKKVGAAAATTTYLTTDQLGAPMFALNPAGTELWKGGFEPFGRDWQEGTGNDALTKGIFLRLPGQWDDTLFGNATLGADSYYNVHRWYEQPTGRYQASDPIGLRGGLNLYNYANGQPTINFDLDGRWVRFYCALAHGGVWSVYWKFFTPTGGDKYIHCLASCDISHSCGPDLAAAAGLGKEIWDVLWCAMGNNSNCHSRFEPGDLSADIQGLSCPIWRPCEDRCEQLKRP